MCARCDRGFFVEEVLHDEILLVASAHHPLAAKGELSPRDLHGQTLVVREEGSGTGLVVRDHLASLGIREPAVYMVSMSHPEAMKRAVETGAALAVLPRITVSCELEDGRLVILNAQFGKIERPLSMISAKKRRLSPGARDLR